jgi:hypothetical protein
MKKIDIEGRDMESRKDREFISELKRRMKDRKASQVTEYGGANANYSKFKVQLTRKEQ